MKKSFFLLICTLLFSGCQEDYFAEKEFYKASKVMERMKITVRSAGKSAPSNEDYEPVILAYEDVAEKYPGTTKAVESLNIVSRLRETQKNFEEARAALKKVIQNFSREGDAAAEARFRIAQLYELEGRWKDAEVAYWETARYHPIQTKGLYAPLHIFLHYKREGAPLKELYIKVKEHYEKVLRQIGPIQVSARMRNALALVHLLNDDWQKAREEWLSTAREFAGNPYAPVAILAAADASSQHGEAEVAVGLYRRYLKQYPKHSLVGKTTVRIGLLHLRKKNFEASRQWFQKALKHFAGNDSAQAEIKLLIGKSYEEEGSWPAAEKIYNEIEREYPTTIVSLQVPLLIWTYLNAHGEPEKAKSELENAAVHYEDIVKENKGTRLEHAARRFMNYVYAKQGNWDKILNSINFELNKEVQPLRKGEWLFAKALITEKRLQDKTKAFNLYQDFLTQYPDHPLAGSAKSHLEVLSKN